MYLLFILIQKTVKEFATSLTFAHEISHNLGADHDVDRNGYAVNDTLMGETLGNHVTISNLKISPKTKTKIKNFLTEVRNGIRYDLFKKLDNFPGMVYFTEEWTEDDQNRFKQASKQGHHRINCLKTKLDYTNDEKHFLKLKQDLENQVNPKTPKTPKAPKTESTKNSGSNNLNVTYVKYFSLFLQLLLFSCTYMSHF